MLQKIVPPSGYNLEMQCPPHRSLKRGGQQLPQICTHQFDRHGHDVQEDAFGCPHKMLSPLQLINMLTSCAYPQRLLGACARH